MPPQRTQLLWVAAAGVICLCVYPSVTDAASTADTVLNIKHQLGRASLDATEGRVDSAVALIDKVKESLDAWREELVASKSKADEPSEDFDTGAVFGFEPNGKPVDCPDDAKTAEGDVLKVHYIAKLLKTGKIAKTSFHTGSVPFKFTLGSESVVEGWNRGLTGMCRGERRKLTVPYALAYGEAGSAGFPPKADLEYFVELVDVSKRRAPKADLRILP